MSGCPLLCWVSPALKCSPYLPGGLPEARWGSFVGTRNSAGPEPNGRTPLGQNAHPGFSSLFSQTEGVAQGPKHACFPESQHPPMTLTAGPLCTLPPLSPSCPQILPTPKLPAWKGSFLKEGADLRAVAQDFWRKQ